MKLLPPVLAAVCLSSCAQMSQIKDVTVSGLNKASESTRSSFANLMPSRIPVVEVREKDLREVPSGQDQALAFERTKQRRFWDFLSGPADFTEPTLPEDLGSADSGLLPARTD